MGLPARWISPVYGECLTAHAAAAYVHERGCECRVDGRSVVIPAQPERRLEPVDTPMGRMFPVAQLDAILESVQPLSSELKPDYNPD
ncbi:MAG: hypothetical protein IPM16_17735 [Chloroflexi bacterium]|nr:hypothetical protein [Chloroflexota bacterium]